MNDMDEAAVITGAARGIGAAITQRFIDDDRYTYIACLDFDESILEQWAGEKTVQSFVVDVRDFEAIERTVETIEEVGPISALVNNAAISRSFWIGDLTPEEWDSVLDVNLKGQFHLARAIGPKMYDRKHGYIVNVSSGAGQRGSMSAGVHYSASKAGIFGLTRGLAKQLGPHVRVNCVVPGLIQTPLTADLWDNEELEALTPQLPLERLGDPDEVARMIAYLCGDGAEYMTGSIVTVDGGASLR